MIETERRLKFDSNLQFFADDVVALEPFLSSIADAIRSVNRTSASIPAQAFANSIVDMPRKVNQIVMRSELTEYIDYDNAVNTIRPYAFYRCTRLSQVSFPACTTIGIYAFTHCTVLSTCYFMGSSVPTLSLSTAFQNTGITSSKGSIYVRSSLANAFKTASYWSYFSNVIFGI